MTTKTSLTEEMRDKAKTLGLSYKILSPTVLDNLRDFIANELEKQSPIPFMVLEKEKKKDTIRDREGNLTEAYFRVKSHYFRKREAISFNSDGFIGFAGWSDSENVQPFVKAFNRWLEYLVNCEVL